MKLFICGATSDIAIEFAKLYAPTKSEFFLVGRDNLAMNRLKEVLIGHGAKSVELCLHDVQKQADHAFVVEKAVETLHTIDLAIFAHGYLGDQKSSESNYVEAHKVYDINFLSIVSLLTHLTPYFESQKHGAITVIGSVAGDRGRQSNFTYGSAKAALETYCEGLRNKLFRSGVRVLFVKPGFIDTKMTQHMKKNFLFASPTRVAKDMRCALKWNLNSIYTPFFWCFIMAVIRSIPECIFKRLRL